MEHEIALEIRDDGEFMRAVIVYAGRRRLLGAIARSLRDVCPGVYDRWVSLVNDALAEFITRSGGTVVSKADVSPLPEE